MIKSNTDNRKKTLSRLGFAAMLAVGFANFFLALRFFISPSVSSGAMFNCGVDVLGAFVCAMLYFGCMGDSLDITDDSTIWFRWLILFTGLSFLNNEVLWYLTGSEAYGKYCLLHCKASRRQKTVAISFIFIPIIHYVATGGVQGYATQYGSVLISLILMYCIIFGERSQKLASTQTELNTATAIQEAMLPTIFPAYPERPEFDLYASMDAAKEVGGDFYDFFLIDDDHLCMVIADVSGKGVPAALFMMVSKVILQNCAMLGQSPADILKRANEAICSNNETNMFVTVWIGILEISTGTITAANAGHEYPMIMKDGEFRIIKGRHGLVIGGMEGVAYKDYEIKL